MPGLYGYIKKTQNDDALGDMSAALSYMDHFVHEPRFQDDHIEASRVHIGTGNTTWNDLHIHIWIDGEVYNIADFSTAICDAYKNGRLDDLLKTTNGQFCAVLYDKKIQKVLLITERLGMRPLFYYFHEGRFAWASEVKAILALDFVDTTIDQTSPECFMDIGYLLEERTWFEHIKVPKPASIYTFDLKEKTLDQNYYFKWSEIKQRDISFDDAVDQSYELFMRAFKRCFDPEARMGIGLSGGLDSRLLLAAADKLHPDYKGFSFTFGREDSEDVAIAKRVIKLTNWHYKLYPFTCKNWFEPRFDQILRTDGMLNMLHMHGGEFLRNMKDHADIFLNGYAGDTVLGGGFLTSENLDRRIDLDNAKPFYRSKINMTDLDNTFYDIPHSEPHLYANRCRRFTHLGAVNSYAILDIRMPFLDLELMEFVFSIPDYYRKDNKLYAAMLLKYFPEFYKGIPWQKTGKTIDKRPPHKLIKRIQNKIKRTLAAYGIGKNKGEYVAYGKWIREPEIAAILSNLLNYKSSEYSKIYAVDLHEKYLKPHLEYKYIDNSDRILRAVTMEIYLRNIFRKSYE